MNPATMTLRTPAILSPDREVLNQVGSLSRGWGMTVPQPPVVLESPARWKRAVLSFINRHIVDEHQPARRCGCLQTPRHLLTRGTRLYSARWLVMPYSHK
jgi:hypothetical protein